MLINLRRSFVQTGIFNGEYVHSAFVTGDTKERRVVTEADTEKK